MESKDVFRRRGRVCLGLVFAVLTVFCFTFFKIQVIDGEEYVKAGEQIKVKNVEVEGARGEILDRNGSPLVTNRQGNSIVFDSAFFPSSDEQTERNKIIYSLICLFEQQGVEWNDNLPIVLNKDGTSFSFVADREKDIDYLRTDVLELNGYATAQNCMDAFLENYGLEKFPLAIARKMASVFYGMHMVEFGVANTYTFADDVPNDMVSKIKENSNFYRGVDVEIVSYREYTDGDLLPHVLGRVGVISAEEYEKSKEEKTGYRMNSIIGKDGIESAMEEYLRGTVGEKSIVTDSKGNVTTNYTVEPTQGNTVVLTIEKNLQEVAKNALAEGLEALRENSVVNPAGAIIIEDVNNGEILASSSYPGYDITTFAEDYAALSKDSRAPLWNRALKSTYSPGSTMKPCTAIAALEEGVITRDTYFRCTRSHTYLKHQFQCLQPHKKLTMNVVSAINESCNIFFYNVAERMNIETINEYAGIMGLGSKTGVELPEANGILDSPEYRASIKQEWQPGFTLQNAIGNGGNMFTPVQLVNYCSTIANGGTRYRPHFVKNIKSYDYSETVLDNSSQVVLRTGIKESTLKTVREGMALVGSVGYCSNAFKKLPVKAAAKTGTSQVDRKINGYTVTTNNGFLITYAPADNPQIAICIAAEGAGSGSSLAPIAARVYDYYFNEMNSLDEPQIENELLK
ncbi:MAG TPA: hypothetical protein DDY98_08585 [Ruminococcaceae bacterium]|nr:hypothetical protein [Oscillospiraceae bacterium]